MLGAGISLQMSGKLLDLRTFDKGGTIYHCLNSGVYLRLNLPVLTLQIHHLNGCHNSQLSIRLLRV